MRPMARSIHWVLIGLVVSTMGLLAACAEMRPLEYREISEIQAGPGLLSGEEGAFTFKID